MIECLLLLVLDSLTLQETLYPLGFPVLISTNSEAVARMARAEWGEWMRAFDQPPIRLRIEVSRGSGAVNQGAAHPPAAQFRADGHLFVFAADSENVAVCDTRARTGTAWLTARAVEDSSYFRYHFLDGMVYLFIEILYLTPIHAACVALGDRGMLLCGDSGAGKSTLAYALARRGWTYVTDDASYLVRHGASRLIIGNSQRLRLRPDAALIFPELAAHTAGMRGNGRPSLDLWTRTLNSIAANPATNADRIVFLRRKQNGEARLELFEKAHAFVWCKRVFFQWNPEVAAEQAATVSALIEASRVETLEYSKIEEAIDLLEK